MNSWNQLTSFQVLNVFKSSDDAFVQSVDFSCGFFSPVFGVHSAFANSASTTFLVALQQPRQPFRNERGGTDPLDAVKPPSAIFNSALSSPRFVSGQSVESALYLHFPDGLSLEPIQTRNARHSNNSPPPRVYRAVKN